MYGDILREKVPLEVQVVEAADALAVALQAYRCKLVARREARGVRGNGKDGSRRVASAARSLSSNASAV